MGLVAQLGFVVLAPDGFGLGESSATHQAYLQASPYCVHPFTTDFVLIFSQRDIVSLNNAELSVVCLAMERWPSVLNLVTGVRTVGFRRSTQQRLQLDVYLGSVGR